MHGWLTGNLGDLWHTMVLLRRVRRKATRVDISGFPGPPDPRCEPVLRLADQVLFENPVPPRARFRRLFWAARWRHHRATLFRAYDAIISIPGPYLRVGDARRIPVELDIQVANAVRRPFLLACHSIGPVTSRTLKALRCVDAIVAREPVTQRYLAAKNVRCVQGSDFAFSLIPNQRVEKLVSDSRLRDDFGLVFLRYNNLDLHAVTLQGNELAYRGEVLWRSSGNRLVLATSDIGKDAHELVSLASRFEVSVVLCHTLDELATLTSMAKDVVSDRYHPAIAAALARKPVAILDNCETHKMAGLRELLEKNTLSEIVELSERGLRAVDEFLAHVCGGGPMKKHAHR